jgi:hypothetical protein
MTRRIDLEDQRFGRWLVLSRVVGSPQMKYLCRCDCGAEREVYAGHLRHGRSSSCGCLAAEINRTRDHSKDNNPPWIMHGHTAGKWSPTYITWSGIVARCTNPKSEQYRWYGARGILICERWRKFENFLADMGERPPGLTIDRKDSNGHYEPGNCRWASKTVQASNMRSTKLGPLKKLEAAWRVLVGGEKQVAVAASIGVSVFPVWDVVTRIKRDDGQAERLAVAAHDLGELSARDLTTWRLRAFQMTQAAKERR